MAKKKLILASIVCGVIAALLMVLYVQDEQKRVEEERGSVVLVYKASTKIEPGAEFNNNLVELHEVPQKFLPPNPVTVSDFDRFNGSQFAVPVMPGEMIITTAFAQRDTTLELADRIAPGYRAMTIAVDQVSGVAGLIKPGDRVDILGTFPTQEEGEGGQREQGFATVPLLQRVSVLATGQNMSGERASGRKIYPTLTISVSSLEEAELLTLVQTRGKLSMLLRNPEDVETDAGMSKQTLSDILKRLGLIAEVRKKKESKPRPRPKPKKPWIVN